MRGLRLRDVQRETGIPDSVLSAVERGERPLRGRALKALADLYSTPAERLLAEMHTWGSGRVA